ncbi:MAG TPA: hypothetical protein VF014_04140 [Casimicrobiaceae bacterium]|nr:hypothetical protein [Casimicrobiaceae bacterium]
MVVTLSLALAGCNGTMQQQKIVAHVESLPPVSVAVPVSCVKKLPDPPTVVIDAPTLKQRYYQMRAAIEDLDRYYKEADIALRACAQEVPNP